ncbi:isoprenyl transferase, partial [Sesbania bispinosa]
SRCKAHHRRIREAFQLRHAQRHQGHPRGLQVLHREAQGRQCHKAGVGINNMYNFSVPI